MIVVDANLLLYAYSESSPHHQKARAWLEKVLSGLETVGLPWQTLAAFVRIATDPRIPGYRRSAEEVIRTVHDWLEQPVVRLLVPSERTVAIFWEMVLLGQASGPLVTDAELAALTLEYGGVLHTADRDFARFPGLRWVNPLEKS
jgi:toxin-antitoxin system PIN domain toxin